MKILEQIKKPIKSEMDIFEDKFSDYMKSNVPLLNRIMHYIVRRKGKQMRPMFLFLCANLNGKTTDKSYRSASIIELMHTATLVHDDVVDDSNLRRGFFSVNALWKNKVAVLVGDFLLSKALLISVDNGDFDELKIISEAIRQMSEGELLQIEKARKLNITEEIYFEIIEKKTAVLIASCCSAGAKSVNSTQENVDKMWEFGKLIGIAFQIKDDLFDYQNSNIIGKPTGIDIKEQKMTLPLIYTLNNCSKKDKKWLINSVKNHNTDKKRVSEVLEFVKKSKGVDYAVEIMKQYRDKSLEILNTYPDSDYKKSLELMINYVIDRKK